MIPRRARKLGETLKLARAAAADAGVTRLADISALAGLGLPVFQAVRPFARSLTVSQGKGGSAMAAKISALLEASELACGEALPEPAARRALDMFPDSVRRFWSGDRPALAINLNPCVARGWVDGTVLGSGDPMPMPWDLLSLDFTRAPLEYAATSDGLATGNTLAEALLAALCELVEHDLLAGFQALSAGDRRALQIDAGSISDQAAARELARVGAAGFTPRLWSLGQHHGIPAIACTLFAPEPVLDGLAPTAGSACHPDPATAVLAALREAVQARAALVAGARDDIVPEDYIAGPSRARALAIASLAIGEGTLPWSTIPAPRWNSAEHGVELLRRVIAGLTPLSVAVFHHPSPVDGLEIVHALAPGLRNLARRRMRNDAGSRPTQRVVGTAKGHRPAILFAGPSIRGLAIPPQVELRPPAVAGDLAVLRDDPPAVVGLVDGLFGTAPSVWHKEILDLVARGVQVFGAASIGALRAAELADAGMHGVGTIYAAYRCGAIERDDAVMLIHAPSEFAFAPLTLPLVDAECALYAIGSTPRERRMMQRIVRTADYTSRSWARCLAEYRRRTGADFPLSEEELGQIPSLKQRDAAALIERMCKAVQECRRPEPRPAPPLTGFYLRLLARLPAEPAPDLR